MPTFRQILTQLEIGSQRLNPLESLDRIAFPKDEKIKEYEEFFRESNIKLDEIKENDYEQLDKNSKSEYDGLKEMFEMLSAIDLKELKQ